MAEQVKKPKKTTLIAMEKDGVVIKVCQAQIKQHEGLGWTVKK